MTDLHKEIERGQLARQLLDNPLWEESWRIWEEQIHRAWADAPAADTTGREALFFGLQAGLRAKKQIRSVFETGVMATNQLEAEHARSTGKAKSRGPV